jgi:MFS family permease
MWRRLTPEFGGLPSAYWYVWVGMLVNRLGNFVIPFLSLYLTQERHFSVERAGFSVALFGAGAIAAGPVGGFFADRIGRRTTMVAGLCFSASAMAHLAIARSPLHIALATFMLGLVAETYRPAVSAFIADIVPVQDRPRAFGLLYWAANLAFSVCPVVAGLLAGRSFTALFVGDAATTLIFGAIVWLRLPETRSATPATAGTIGRVGFLAPFGDGVFMTFIALTFLLTIVFQQWLVTLPIAMRGDGISAATYGFVIGINGLLIVLLQPAALRFFAGYQRSRVLALAAGLVGLGFGATAFAKTAPAYAACIAVWTLGEIALASVAPAVVADLATSTTRGTYQGVYQMAWGGAAFVGPIVGSAMMGALGARYFWFTCGVVAITAAIGHLTLAGPREKRLAAARDGSTAEAVPA